MGCPLEMCCAAMLVLMFALCCNGRPTDSADADNDNQASSILLNWGKFLFAEDGLVQRRLNKGVVEQLRRQPTTRNKAWDLGGILQNLGMNLRPQETGIMDIFEYFDLSKMGLCNRDTCGDIYKFLDKIRNSSFMLNLRTLFALLKDDEGLELLKMVLTNPSMLKTFLGSDDGGGIMDLGKPDKPDIAFNLDNDKKPGDYDDYYFNGGSSRPPGVTGGDQIMTVKRPTHDVSINATNLRTATKVVDDSDTASGDQEEATRTTVTSTSSVDYYAYYYDDQPQSSGGQTVSDETT